MMTRVKQWWREMTGVAAMEAAREELARRTDQAEYFRSRFELQRERHAKALAELRRPKFATEHADDAPGWTPEMAEAWRHFLGTHEAGRALQRLGNFHEQQTNRAAVHRTSGAESNAGYARGWHDATAYFFKTLSADARPQQGTDTQAQDDAGALRERLAS